MKKLITLLTFSLFLLAACNNSSSSAGQAADTAGDTEQMAESEGESQEPQDEKSERQSPPRTTTGSIGDIQVTIKYGAPSIRGRKIFGKLVPFDEVWRTGANEATTITLSKAATIEGKTLAAGRYSLFTVPGEEKWTVIFNSVPEQWGAYEYDESKDALRVRVTPQPLAEPVEELEFLIEEGQIVLRWESTAVPIQVTEKKEVQ